jgi:translation initiation factor 2 gamma subunit (eIF-2gamma)
VAGAIVQQPSTGHLPEPDLELRLARFLIMEAVIREKKTGISELQNRNALLLHICCASGLKAKLDVDRMENA